MASAAVGRPQEARNGINIRIPRIGGPLIWYARGERAIMAILRIAYST